MLRLLDATAGEVYFDDVDVLSLKGNDLKQMRRISLPYPIAANVTKVHTSLSLPESLPTFIINRRKKLRK
jgi:hypothetical protein